jgi:hypothetical protein
MYLIARLILTLARVFKRPEPPAGLDRMSLRDWADLPPYHPRCD